MYPICYSAFLFLLAANPSSKLLKVEHNVVYLASPDGSIVALRANDGTVLWSKMGR
ncbi:MAG TPA: hypothetical protein DCS90_04505 [Ktedonobacter sp.]|nr:hypothetical protein [Ktedonobacter sp.]